MPDLTFEITNTDINSLIGSSLTVTANNGTELIFDAVSGRLMKIRVSPDSTVLTKTELQKKLFHCWTRILQSLDKLINRKAISFLKTLKAHSFIRSGMKKA